MRSEMNSIDWNVSMNFGPDNEEEASHDNAGEIDLGTYEEIGGSNSTNDVAISCPKMTENTGKFLLKCKDQYTSQAPQFPSDNDSYTNYLFALGG